MSKTIIDFTNDPRFQLMRRLNDQILKHPLDPQVTIKLQLEIGSEILPESSGRMIVPTTYGFPMIIDLATSHAPSMQGSIERNLYFLGTYEPGTLNVIKQSLHSWGKDACFIDVGAHNGLMSIYAASMDAATVYSFEPNPFMFELLKANLKLSGHKNIIPFALAIGDKQQTVSIETDTQNSGAARVSKSDTASIHDVPMNTLDHMAQECRIKYIHLILIDVEGYEINVLRGAERIISNNRPDLIIEYNPNNHDEQVINFLKHHDYRIYVLEHSRHIPSRLIPFKKITGHTQMDNFFCFQTDRAKKLSLA